MVLNEMNGCELVALAAILAVNISSGLTIDEINTLGNFFSALGDNLNIIGNSK